MGKEEPANTVWRQIMHPRNVLWLQPKQVGYLVESPAGMTPVGVRTDGSEESGGEGVARYTSPGMMVGALFPTATIATSVRSVRESTKQFAALFTPQ